MSPVHCNKNRENRIAYEAVVDAYDTNERAIGWYYYLEGKITFPFTARWSVKHGDWPLKKDEELRVIRMSTPETCEADMFVVIKWNQRNLSVPLKLLNVIEADVKTREAIDDWHYWIARGYEF